MTPKIAWARIGAEGVVIVLSILLALAAEAWWSGREADRDGREDLAAVREELEERRSVMQFAHDWHLRALHGVRSMQVDLGSTADGSTLAVSDTIASQLLWIIVSDPVSPTLDSYLASGHAERLRSAELRLRLLRWRSILDDMADDESRAARHVDDRVLPFVQHVSDFSRAIELVFTMYAGDADPTSLRETEVPVGPDIRNLVARQISLLQLNTSQSEAALERATDLMRLIESELR